MIPLRIKLLTPTAKAPEAANEGDLLDLFADSFSVENLESPISKTKVVLSKKDTDCELLVGARVLVKTGIALDLPVQLNYGWAFKSDDNYLGEGSHSILAYAVADLRPCSGLALKYGITILNASATIDNSYRKEIGVILINHGHEPYTIRKGDKIAQMLIRPLYTNKMEVVNDLQDSGRGAYGSSGI
jgi:dUTPase